MKIVVIDDDPDIVRLVSYSIKFRWPDAVVEHTSNGHEGLDLVGRGSPDLVILDIGLPDTDGRKVFEQMRAFSDVPVIMLTAHLRYIETRMTLMLKLLIPSIIFL